MPYLNNTEEIELHEYLIQANKVGYGKTRCQVKMIAKKVANDKGLLRGAQISGVAFYNDILTSHLEVGIVLVMCE